MQESNSGSAILKADALTTQPTRWCQIGDLKGAVGQARDPIDQSGLDAGHSVLAGEVEVGRGVHPSPQVGVAIQHALHVS